MGPPGKKKSREKIIDPNGCACYAYPAGGRFPRASGVDANTL
jgi:hypothetical protein